MVNSALNRGLELSRPKEASEHATDGVSALVGEHWVVVGKRSFVSQTAGLIPDQEPTGGQLAVYVGVDSRYAGALIMSDPLRENAVETLAELRRLGVKHTLKVTGDAQATAQHIAIQAGITEVRAGCRPSDKVSIVQKLIPKPVMMVGDGINNAPVLAVADVGVAMGAKGSTAASESADVVIMVDDLSKVSRAVLIGKDTTRIAVQGIWIGIVLSLGLMVFAAGGLIPAVAGALSQELVDLATIFNELRTLKWIERLSVAESKGLQHGPSHIMVQS